MEVRPIALISTLCITASVAASCLMACCQEQQPVAVTEPTTATSPPQDNATSNGGFWYPSIEVTYQGEAGATGSHDDPVVSLAIESSALDAELPATIEAVTRVSFDGFDPGQRLSVDLSYGPVSPGPNQPCVYSAWRATPAGST